ncbi:MAG: cytochrome b5 domain-containing protein [Sporolactobacillus sp.]
MKKLLILITMMAFVLTGCTSVAQNTVKKVTHTNAITKHLNASRTFTLAQLSHYDGRNGRKAYIAVSGKVYDVTHAPDWKNGQHHGAQAGQDLTEAISHAPHGTSVLAALPIVGSLVPAKTTGKQTKTIGQTSQSKTAASSSAQKSGKAFTLAELKKYNGQNGAPAYVAVSGKVYDVTHAPDWHNGYHHGVQAGQDLTQAIERAPHGTSVLSQLKVVGYLK